MFPEYRAFRARYAGLIRAVGRENPGFWLELRELALAHDRRRHTTHGGTVVEFPETRESGSQTEESPETRGRGMQTVPPPGRTIGVQTEGLRPHPTAAGSSSEGGRPEPAGSCGRGRGLRLRQSSGSPVVGGALRGPLTRTVGTSPRTPSPTERGRQGRTPRRTSRPRRSPAGRQMIDRSPARESRPTRRSSASRSPVRRRDASQQLARRPTRGANVCWNCQSAEHRYSNCPEPRGVPYCYGCGRNGVTMRTCPTCGPEWRDLGPYHPDRGHLGRRTSE